MLIVRGAIKDYDWGVVDGLEPWSGQATGAPQAELWFGVHPGGPSPLIDDGALVVHHDDTISGVHIPTSTAAAVRAQQLPNGEAPPLLEELRAAGFWRESRTLAKALLEFRLFVKKEEVLQWLRSRGQDVKPVARQVSPLVRLIANRIDFCSAMRARVLRALR